MNNNKSNQNDAGEIVATIFDIRSTVGQKFDDIRFPQYRLASKLAWLQKESHFDKIDLFNCIEEFREFGLNATDDLSVVIGTSQVYLVIQSLFINLNQRLPQDKSINGQKSIELLYKLLTSIHDPKQANYINVFALKITLAMLSSNCCYTDKLSYFFTLISEEGNLVKHKFDLFLKHLLAIPAYFESLPIYDYAEDLHSRMFDFSKNITLYHFAEAFKSYENQIDFKSWLVVFHRLVDAQSITHNIKCNVCKAKCFQGFKYVCKKCSGFNMCQQCFWTGKTSGSHNVDKHPCKEYLVDPPKNNLRRSFRKSFRFFPAKHNEMDSAFIRNHQHNSTIKKLDLSYIVSSPSCSSTTSSSTAKYQFTFHDLPVESPSMPIFDSTAHNELSLITSYLSSLNEAPQTETCDNPDESGEDVDEVDSGAVTSTNLNDFEQIIESLESKNRELMKSITSLRNQQPEDREDESESVTFQVDAEEQDSEDNDHEDEVDKKLEKLEEKRKYLMLEMDNMMKQYKVDPNKMVDIISLSSAGVNSS